MPVYHFTLHAYRSWDADHPKGYTDKKKGCKRRGWRLHGMGTDKTHSHHLLSWRDFIPWNEVVRVLKNVLSLMRGRLKGEEGRRWFVADASHRRVERRKHFDYLIKTYFPDHRGLKWTEGDPLPEIPARVLDEPRASARGYKKYTRIPKKRQQPKRKPRDQKRDQPPDNL